MTEQQEALREALKRTGVVLKEGGIPYALGGGYASWALGGPEPEHDVDFLVAEQDQEHAARVLAEAGLEVVRPPEDWLFKVCCGGAMVDVLFRVGGVPVGHALLERAVDVEVLSVRMQVLDATDVIVSKLVALSEHACDYGKVLPSARALREQVDWERVRSEVEHSPYAAAFLVLVQRLGVAPGLSTSRTAGSATAGSATAGSATAGSATPGPATAGSAMPGPAMSGSATPATAGAANAGP